MSLPKSCPTTEEYFESCLKFFKKYHYLICSPNTHVLVDNILEHIDIDGLENINFKTENFDLAQYRDKSRYLNEFLVDLEKLKVDYEIVVDEEVEADFGAPISGKKWYEVAKLSDEIEKLCRVNGCDTVVDFGSGLGYLDQRFHETTGFQVLGVECDAGHHARSVHRQETYHAASRGSVVYVQHSVDKESGGDIEGFLKENFKSHGSVCIAGLHSCGDLTVDAMHVFLAMRSAKALILMPCCYHRMKQEGNRFKNFPLSACLKRLSSHHEALDLMQIPFMRLAAHPARRQPLHEMAFSLLARAVLQVYAAANNYTLKRNKRKATKKSGSFEEYVRQAASGYTLEADELSSGDGAFDLDQLRCIWRSIRRTAFARAAVYIQLQTWMQPVAEELLLRDRTASLEVNGVHCCLRKLFSDERSPRCTALVAVKDT